MRLQYMLSDRYFLILLLIMVLGLLAQYRVKKVFADYSQVQTRRGEAASSVVSMLLQRAGNGDVTVARIDGSLTDHYDPRSSTLRLSSKVYGSSSVAAIGVAAHEAGHAMQHAARYAPLALRSVMVPVVNIGSQAAWPLFLLGIIVSWQPLMYVGTAAFSLTVLFSLVTLPVEFDASRRALAMLRESGWYQEEEIAGAAKVLRAAAMTYVISALSSIVHLLRLLAMANSRRRD